MTEIWMDIDTALSEVPVNVMPLVDDTDFKTIEDSVAYNASGMDLVWNFATSAGAFTQTAVVPTTGGVHDWTSQANGLYTIEIPDTGGTINNDTAGAGWFTGVADGVLPWRGPVIGFRAAGINTALINGAWSATRGLAGTALPDAAADAAFGLIISDAGGLDADAILEDTNSLQSEWANGGRLDVLLDQAVAANGTGAYTVTINVKDTAGSPANLENARVRLTEGVNTFVANTDSSGDAVFALDAATYSYAITKNGYTSETGSTVVSATATFNYDIEQSSITPSSGSDTATGVLTCYDEHYAAEPGIVFSMQMTAGPGLAGDSLDTTVKTATSAVTTGLVQFTNLVRGATYNLWRSTFTTSSVFGSVATANAKVPVVVPDAASFDLPEVLGVDE